MGTSIIPECERQRQEDLNPNLGYIARTLCPKEENKRHFETWLMKEAESNPPKTYTA
jgi:hypothetical protein